MLVLQQTPLAVTSLPLSSVIFPPDTAAVAVMAVTAVVVRLARVPVVVVNMSSSPYAVPLLFVAEALTWYSVPLVNPLRLLVKVPFPVPSVVCEPDIVGLAAIPQQTPFAVISLPLSSVIFPPDRTSFTSLAYPLIVYVNRRFCFLPFQF